MLTAKVSMETCKLIYRAVNRVFYMMRGFVVKGLRSQICDLNSSFLFWVKKSAGMNRVFS